MKKTLLFSLFLLLNVILIKAQKTNVLFIGNSYTGVNNLPSLVKNLALSLGDSLNTDSYTPGGYTFNLHSTNSTTLSKIAQGTWDYVVLQAQSQEPSFPPSQVASQTYPYAATLVNAIRQANSCTEPVFYMTWGRKNGDASNCAFYTPLCTYEGMQQRLRESYLEMSADNSATTSAVGIAWKNFRDTYPTIDLYTADESHPSIYGSYLAACVFYATFYKKSPVGATYIPSGISASDATNIQNVASYTVLDSLDLWRIDANKPIADYSYTGNGTVNFTNNSTNGDSYFWDFGDGSTSSLASPSHIFPGGGIYTVELITFSADSCFSDTISKDINILSTGISEVSSSILFSIFPNPTKSFLTIESKTAFTNIVITDITGKEVKNLNGINKKVEVSDLQKGVYFLKIFDKNNLLISTKFIKE